MPHRSVRLWYPCISVCLPPDSPCLPAWLWWWWWWWWWCDTNFPVTIASKCSSKFSQLTSSGAESNHTRVQSATRLTICIYIERLRLIIHAILWCSKSYDCNKDEYDGWNALWLWNPNNHYCKNMAPSLPQSWAESQLLLMSPADLHRGLSCSNIWVSYKSNIGASWMPLHNCRWFQKNLRMLLQSLRALCLAPGGAGSI